MYENLKKAVNAYYDNQRNEFAFDLDNATACLFNDWWYDQYTTPAVKTAISALSPSERIPVNLKAKILQKYNRMKDKEQAAKLAKIESVEAADALESVTINVEWKRSRTWGSNPHVDAVVLTSTCRYVYTASASGYGYDKESTAIARALNASPEVMRILYGHAERGGEFPYSVTTFAGLPSFDCGCGVPCFNSVFSACGYTFRQIASGRSFDVYTLEKGK